MCGFFSHSFSVSSSKLNESLLREIGATLEHRGKDYLGIKSFDGFQCIHSRLSIIDLTDAANQPLVCARTGAVLVFNGEIFNYKEIGRRLDIKDVRSDSAVLLEAYTRIGESCFKDLRGFYSFVIYDPRSRVLLAHRDPAGIKPLYYHFNGKTLVTCSEIKGIIASGLIKPQIDVIGLHQYLELNSYYGETTIFKGIKSLLKGTVLKFFYDKLSISRYSVCYSPLLTNTSSSFDKIVDSLDDLLHIKANEWVTSDVPVSSYLSGGIDSSLVTYYASQYCANINTYTSYYPSTSEITNEIVYAQYASGVIGCSNTLVGYAEQELIDCHKNLLYKLDQPLGGSCGPYFLLSGEVKKNYSVVFSGHGGDELFYGYPRYLGAIGLAHKLNFLKADDHFVNDILNTVPNSFRGQMSCIMSSECDSLASLLRACLGRTSVLSSYLSPFLTAELGDYNIYDDIVESQFSDNKFCMSSFQALEEATLLQSLLSIEDRASMCSTLESRPLLLDYDIASFAKSIPWELSLANGPKSILRGLLRKKGMPIIADRRDKNGTVYPVDNLFRESIVGNQVDYFRNLVESEVFSPDVLHLLSAETVCRTPLRVLWSLWSINQWMSSFRISC